MRPFTPLAPWETTALSTKAPRILLAQCERSKSAPWQPPAASGRVPARLSRQMSGSAPARPSPAARPRMSSSAPAHPSRAGRRRVSGSPRTRSTLSSSLHVCQGRSATVPRLRSRLVLHGLRPPHTGIAPWPRAAHSQIFAGIREASPIHPAPTQRLAAPSPLTARARLAWTSRVDRVGPLPEQPCHPRHSSADDLAGRPPTGAGHSNYTPQIHAQTDRWHRAMQRADRFGLPSCGHFADHE